MGDSESGQLQDGDRVSSLLTQRNMLLMTIFCVVAFVYISTLNTIFGSLALKSASLALVSSLLGAAVVGLLWEQGSKRAFGLEMQRTFTHMVEAVARQATIASQAEREGLLAVTRDFHFGIPWSEYIDDADSIDICWWAGRTWFKQNMDSLRSRAEDGGLHIRVVTPDTDLDPLLEQMHRDSGLSKDNLRLATDELRDILSTFPANSVEWFKAKSVPRYACIRVGRKLVYFPYALVAGRSTGRPCLICAIGSPLGDQIKSELEGILAISDKVAVL